MGLNLSAFLARFNVSADQAAAFIISRASTNPLDLHATLVRIGMSNDWVAQTLQGRLPGITADAVRTFFNQRGLDADALDRAHVSMLAGQDQPGAGGEPATRLGTERNDNLTGTANADRISGLGGNDTISGLAGNDSLDGGAGNDRLIGGSGADTLIGSDGNDIIWAGTSNTDATELDVDSIDGGAGADTIVAQSNDHVSGGAGDDHITILPVSSSRSGEVIGGAGADTIIVQGMRTDGWTTINLGAGEGNDTVASADSADTIWWNTLAGQTFTVPSLVISGFNPANDRINIGTFHTAFQTNSANVIDAVRENAPGGRFANVAQTLTAPDQPFMRASANPTNQDQWGKGFFVIQGAAASADDSAAIAAFLDSYGANHTFGANLRHYFLLNTGNSHSVMAVYVDDGRGDNQVNASEIVPILILAGVRTEDFNSASLMNAFI